MSSDTTQGPHSSLNSLIPTFPRDFPPFFPSLGREVKPLGAAAFPEEQPACYPCFLRQELSSLSPAADRDYHPWVLHSSWTTKAPQGVTPGWPGMESCYPDIPGSSQSAAPHPLPGLWHLEIRFLSRFCFCFHLSARAGFVEGFSGTGHNQRTGPILPGKAQRGQSWTKQDFGFK